MFIYMWSTVDTYVSSGFGKHMFVELFFLISGAVYLFDLTSKIDFSWLQFWNGLFL